MSDARSSSATPAPGGVFVTGVTGFIGREVAQRLCGAGRSVIELARSRADDTATARVARAVGPASAGRIEVVEGDLGAPDCGLSGASVRRLRDRIGTVIHCAGDTSFFPEALEPFRAAHVDGPRALLERLSGGRLRHFAHLSTAYVCGARSGTVLESEGDVGQGFHNPYERTKLESEDAIREAGRRQGVDVRIFRPSVVVGPAPETSGGSPSKLLFDLIRLAWALAQAAGGAEVGVRVAMAPRGRFNIVPVEYVADAVVLLAEHPEAAGQTFHLTVAAPPSNAEMLAMITGRLGLRGVSLVDPRTGPLAAPSPLERKVERMLAGYQDYLDQDIRFDDSNARRLLDAYGLPRPVLSAEAFGRFIEAALGLEPSRLPPVSPGTTS
jgi:thioester reductase-like protein